jgi:hypothetical protein
MRVTATVSGTTSRLGLETLPINPCLPGKRYSFGASLKIVNAFSSRRLNMFVNWYGVDADGNPVFLSISSGSDSQSPASSGVTYVLRFSEIAPPDALFFTIVCYSQYITSGTGTLTFDIGGIEARVAQTGVFETSAPSGSKTISSGTNDDIVSITSHHTKDARFVQIGGNFKNSSGGTRNFTVIFRKNGTVLKSIAISLQDDNPWYAEFFDDNPTGTDSDLYSIAIDATAATVVVNNRYIITQAFFG